MICPKVNVIVISQAGIFLTVFYGSQLVSTLGHRQEKRFLWKKKILQLLFFFNFKEILIGIDMLHEKRCKIYC